MTEPVMEPGEPESFAVRRCLLAILTEEWEHRLYAEGDFDVRESGRPDTAAGLPETVCWECATGYAAAIAPGSPPDRRTHDEMR